MRFFAKHGQKCPNLGFFYKRMKNEILVCKMIYYKKRPKNVR